MQGTLVMLVALGGLGCHNKGCDVAYAPPSYSSCFGSGCYANWYPGPVMPSCYSGCYGSGYSGCYGGCYGGGCYGSFGGGGFGSCYGGGFNSCYGGGCYTGFHRRTGHGCLLSGLFKCFRHNKRQAACCDGGYALGSMACYGSSYSPAVFGSALGMTYTPYTSGQQSSTMTGPGGAPGVPSEMAEPVPATPVTPQPSAVPDNVTAPPPPTPAPSTTPPAVTVPPTPGVETVPPTPGVVPGSVPAVPKPPST